MVTTPLTEAASFSHSGWRSRQYPHPFRQMLTKTRCGLSTTCSFQFEDVSATTLDENKDDDDDDDDEADAIVVAVLERMQRNRNRTGTAFRAPMLPPKGSNLGKDTTLIVCCVLLYTILYYSILVTTTSI
mmetsp:Transcript_18525/g.38945  ORF Transcript_18525/g.38945 Transcript_18525/m.38945 type:complete len:130 (+) Transcript_18525:925-1314(+)